MVKNRILPQVKDLERNLAFIGEHTVCISNFNDTKQYEPIKVGHNHLVVAQKFDTFRQPRPEQKLHGSHEF